MPSKYKKRKDGRYLVQIRTGINSETGKPVYKNIYATTLESLRTKLLRLGKSLKKV